MLGKIVIAIFVILVIISGIYALRDTKDFTTSSDEAYEKFLEAKDLLSRLYIEEGFEALREAIKLDSNFAIAWAELAAMNRIYNHNEKAEQNLEKAFSQYDNLKKHEKMILDIHKLSFEKKESEAIEKLKEYIEAFPDRIEGHHSLGTYAWRKGDIEIAISEFKKVLQIDPDNAPAYNMLGYLEFSRGNYDKSLQNFDKYIELLPDQANPHDSRGEILMAVGKYDEALKEFKTAHQFEPRFAFVLYHMADAYIFKGMYSKADQTFDEVRRLCEADWQKRELQIHKANSYIARGDYGKAFNIAKTFLQDSTEKKDSTIALWGHILAAFSAAKIDIETARYHQNMADSLMKAIYLEEESYELGDIISWYKYSKGLVNLIDERYKEVLDLEEFIADKKFSRPDSQIMFRNLIARAYFGMGNNDTAYALMKTNLDINPNNPFTLSDLAKLYKKDDKTEKAKETFERLFEVLKDADEGVPRIEEWRRMYNELIAEPA